MDDSALARLKEASSEHVARYLATSGEDGYVQGDAEILILTTIGRRSGKPQAHRSSSVATVTTMLSWPPSADTAATRTGT